MFWRRENRHTVVARATHARLLSLLCAVAALLASPLARAAAPMCNDDATSVAAPPIVMPTDNGTLTASPPCHNKDTPDLLSGKAPLPERGPNAVGTESPPRALPLGLVMPPPWRSAPLPVAKRCLMPARSGFRNSVYRPPRA